MTQTDRIQAARKLLENVTPLKADCGKRCGAACCQPDESGHGGMLLFPGEEALYPASLDWATITDSGLRVQDKPVYFLTCQGTCTRGERPLSCRIFPLTPIVKQDTLALDLDVRAWPVCPLMAYGMQGLSRDFTAAVHAAMHLLWDDEACRAYFDLLTEQLAAFQSF